MLRKKMVVVTAGVALMLAAATGAYAQGHSSAGRALAAAGRAIGVHAGSASAETTATLTSTARLGQRLANVAKTKPAHLTREADEQGENEQECATLTREKDDSQEGQDDQGENDHGCATLTKEPDENGGTLTKHESDSGDQGDNSGGGGD
jgi:hypothetical protein